MKSEVQIEQKFYLHSVHFCCAHSSYFGIESIVIAPALHTTLSCLHENCCYNIQEIGRKFSKWYRWDARYRFSNIEQMTLWFELHVDIFRAMFESFLYSIPNLLKFSILSFVHWIPSNQILKITKLQRMIMSTSVVWVSLYELLKLWVNFRFYDVCLFHQIKI